MKPATLARLVLLACIWGASFLFIKVALEGMHPTLIALGRIGTGAVAVLAVIAIGRRRLPTGSREWARLAFMAIFANMVPFSLISFGEREISSALAAVLNATTPLWTALFAVVLYRTERMTLVRAAGILVGFAGVTVIVLPGADTTGGRLLGSILVVAASASYGIAAPFAKRFVASPPLQGAAGQLILGTAGMAGVAAVLAPGEPFVLTWPRALAVLTLGAVGTGFAWIVFYRIILTEGPTTASLVTYLVPFVSVVIGRIVLSETLRPNVYLGGAIVIASIAIAEGRWSVPARSLERSLR